MAETKKIKTALVSVYHKDGLDELLAELNKNGVKFLSTGGTQSFIESLGYECQKVEDLTSEEQEYIKERLRQEMKEIYSGKNIYD